MDALSLYRAGQLQPAIEALGQELRKQPLDTRRRTFLFELLCFAGEYERAGKQLDVLADASKEAAAGALVYRSALHAERTRQEMFARGEYPMQSAHGSPSGAWNETEFENLADADPRIGPNLEVFIAGSYTWVPFAYIESVEMAAPTKLRDLMWATAILHPTESFRLQDIGEVLLPVLSPLSWRSQDDAVRLGRTTVWEEDSQWEEVPLGQKMFLTPDEDYSLLELRSLKFNSSVETGQSATA
jgi:type VI secretion system protein ImpE